MKDQASEVTAVLDAMPADWMLIDDYAAMMNEAFTELRRRYRDRSPFWLRGGAVPVRCEELPRRLHPSRRASAGPPGPKGRQMTFIEHEGLDSNPREFYGARIDLVGHDQRLGAAAMSIGITLPDGGWFDLRLNRSDFERLVTESAAALAEMRDDADAGEDFLARISGPRPTWA